MAKNTKGKTAGKAVGKGAIYAAHGITYKGGKLISPIGPICELLKDGNTKTGKAVYTFSLLPGTRDFTIDINGTEYTVKGTCGCDCVGCYAGKGRYETDTVIRSMTINTYLVNYYPDFVKAAISAQLDIIGRGEIRIHAAGDFNTADPDTYAHMWREIAETKTTFRFWTYTKVRKYEGLFDGLKNANIVKSIIPRVGFNFGHCDYIMSAYYALKAMGKRVYICKCGFDKEQHCEGCGVCTSYDYVLFLEHSTEYNGEKDPLYPTLREIVMNQ